MLDKLTLSDLEYCLKLSYSFVQIPIQLIDDENNVILSLPNNHVMNNFLISHPWIEALLAKSENKPYFEVYENLCVFASISCIADNRKYFILMGPTLDNKMSFTQMSSLLVFFPDIKVNEFKEYLKYVPSTDFGNVSKVIQFFCFALFGDKISTSSLMNSYVKKIEELKQEDEVEIQLYSRIENMDYHTAYSDWDELSDIIKSSDVSRLAVYLNTPRAGKPGLLSNNPLQQKKYELTTTLTFLMMSLKEKGVDHETAVNLMDYFIFQTDSCRNELEVKTLREKAYYEFTRLVPLVPKDKIYSNVISKAFDYILKNVNSKLTIDNIAEEVNVTPRKLSEMFFKETGISIVFYIQKQKIKIAKNLLRYTDQSLLEISNYLSFSSQSYFIKVFHDIEGITPRKFRELY